ncbi:ammonium transporter [Pseudanabaena sp. FACHB-1998]|uniref:ammonium transporter n=1 Tax=Pseudanabaena sp. FACHB-1998 TaxID=2692858 RepID=UPI001680518D|nr:ammonium transporter [Pseudanabaena sp. FACHB-1998]MBD2178344.1 ammonium transporter [Pseudanabaena sp. FACHB-1998]
MTKTKKKNHLARFCAIAIGAAIFAAFTPTIAHAIEQPTLDSLAKTTGELRLSIDTSWVLITGFLVFFMQCGFAMLEAGLVRQTGVVNTLAENFVDAGITLLAWWATGFAIAFGSTSNGFYGVDGFFLNNALSLNNGAIEYTIGAAGSTAPVSMFTLFFFQFAFSATASTITTGAMAERTDFRGDLIYAFIMGAVMYPLVVHWVWNSGGWLNKLGFHDFAGDAVVHSVGGWASLVGAYLLGPRPNRVWGQIPPAHNLGYATIGTMILWFGWYGFNCGSTLSLSNTGLVGLIAVNTTIGAATGALSALLYIYFRIRQWHLFCGLNGSLAGLVGITAGCAYVMPWAAALIGLVAGVLVLVVVDVIEWFEIDDPVGAFAVHGACGMLGIIAVGLFGHPALTINQKAGLFLGGGFDLLGVQIGGEAAIVMFVVVFSFLMFGTINALGLLRVNPEADRIGIDVYEHGASAWPDVYPIDDLQYDEEEDEDEDEVMSTV